MSVYPSTVFVAHFDWCRVSADAEPSTEITVEKVGVLRRTLRVLHLVDGRSCLAREGMMSLDNDWRFYGRTEAEARGRAEEGLRDVQATLTPARDSSKDAPSMPITKAGDQALRALSATMAGDHVRAVQHAATAVQLQQQAETLARVRPEAIQQRTAEVARLVAKNAPQAGAELRQQVEHETKVEHDALRRLVPASVTIQGTRPASPRRRARRSTPSCGATRPS